MKLKQNSLETAIVFACEKHFKVILHHRFKDLIIAIQSDHEIGS